MPAVNKAVDPKKKPKKRRGKIRLKPRKLNLKGCFKGPEDWDKFDDWVAIKGVPRTLPPPEPIDRGPSVLIKELKRYKKLAIPKIDPVPPECRCFVRVISKSTLRVRASKRLRCLAIPKYRDDDHCVQRCINPAALKYKASELIQCLAMPKDRCDIPCLQLPRPVSKCALMHEPTPKDCWLAIPKIFCPDKWCRDFTKEDCEKKRKKPKELTPWVEFLSIPNYRVLKELRTDEGKGWRKRFPKELNERGKQALEEWYKTPRPEEEEPVDEAQQCWNYVKCLRKQLCIKDERLCNREEEARRAERMKYYENQRRKLEGDEVYEDENAEKADEADDECEESEGDRSGKKRSKKKKKKTKKRMRLVFPEEDEEAKEKRMKEKNHWRYEVVICKQLPAPVPKSALNYEATPDIERMATPKKFAPSMCDANRLGKVKKGALSATASPRVEELAQPKHTSEPVKRDPPRERDEYDRVIIPPPEFGKKLPKVKKYKSKLKCEKDEDECEDEDEGEESCASTKAKEKRPINRIAYAPTIDPVFDPVGACRQLKERKRAGLLNKECMESEDEDEYEEDEESRCTKRSRRTVEKDACSKKSVLYSEVDTDEGDFASTLASRSGIRSVADEAVDADFQSEG